MSTNGIVLRPLGMCFGTFANNVSNAKYRKWCSYVPELEFFGNLTRLHCLCYLVSLRIWRYSMQQHFTKNIRFYQVKSFAFYSVQTLSI